MEVEGVARDTYDAVLFGEGKRTTFTRCTEGGRGTEILALRCSGAALSRRVDAGKAL